MTSSSSSSNRLLALGLLAALVLGACRGAKPVPATGPATPGTQAAAEAVPGPSTVPGGGPGAAPEQPPPTGPLLALFPVQNLTGGAAPVKELTAALRAQLSRSGIALVPDERMWQVLAARRVRYTGGLDRDTALALRDEAGVQGVIIPSLETWVPGTPYRMAMTTRLVSADEEPVIRWLDTYARSGTDAPGLLGMNAPLGIQTLRDQAFDRLAASLGKALKDHRPAPACPGASRAPSRMFRSPLAADPDRQTIAVLPFVNTTGRRDAGEVMALRLLAPLVAAGTIHVVEPGVVRAEMLAYRIGAAGGISLDDAQVILELLRADLVLSGTVRTFEDASGASGAPSVDFSTWVLDRVTGELVWSSATYAAGDDGVFFFGLGRITTASGLACSMARGVVAPLLRGRSPVTAERPPAGIARPSAANARRPRR